MKKIFTDAALSAAAAGAFMLSGCCGYQGFANYETQTEISRGKEKITGEKINLQIEKGKFNIEKLQDFTYEQQFRVDSKRGFIYTEGSGAQVIGNCIFYPFTLVFSPLRLLTMNDKKQKEFGHEYLYTSGRQAWNMFNPFICTMGKFKLEEETLSTKNKTAPRRETRRIPIKDGQLQMTFGKQKKTFPVSVTLQEICKTVFDYPLPEKTAAGLVTYNGKNYPLTLKSSMTLSQKELAAWNSVLNCKTSEQAIAGNSSAALAKLHGSKKIGDSTYKAEKARLENLAETAKFPMRKISNSRIPLSKEYVSGISFLWFEQKFILDLKAAYEKKIAKIQDKLNKYKGKDLSFWDPEYNQADKEECIKLLEKFQSIIKNPDSLQREIRRKNCRVSNVCDYGCFSYQLSNSEDLIFSCGEDFTPKNISKSVLVCKKKEMPSTITMQMVVDNIMKKNPGAAAKKTTESWGKKSAIANVAFYTIKYTQEYLTTKVEIANKNCKWIVKRIDTIKRFQGNKEVLRMAEEAGYKSGVEKGTVKVIISDRKLDAAFEKMKRVRAQKQKQENLRKEKEAQAKALDNL